MGRRLGQHFLSDPRILDRVVDALGLGDRDTVLEIGPGRGTLTARLLDTASRVVAIERDAALARELQERQLPGLEVVIGDALSEDWFSLAGENESRRLKVVGNVPYYITTPLIDKALTPPLPERVVFMVQKEVALRLAGEPGTRSYGALTVGVRAVAAVERLFDVGAGAFRPPPRVQSSVVRLTPLPEPLVVPEEQRPFREFTAALFSRRRKQLGGSLKALVPGAAGPVAALLKRLDLAPEVRAETLPVETLVELFREMRALSLTG